MPADFVTFRDIERNPVRVLFILLFLSTPLAAQTLLPPDGVLLHGVYPGGRAGQCLMSA